MYVDPVILLAAAALVVVALGTAHAQERSRLDEVLQRGSLIVVTLGTVPPFAFKDDKGELVGFDVDVAKLAANALFPRSQQDRVRDRHQRRTLAGDRKRPGRHGRRRHDGLSRPRDPRCLHPRLHQLRHLHPGCQVLGHQISAGPEPGQVHRRQPQQPPDGGPGGRDLPESQGRHLRYAFRPVPRREERPGARAPDRHAHGGLLCRQQRQGFRGAADAAHRVAKQRDLSEARRLQVVALARHVRLRAAHGLALSEIHGTLSRSGSARTRRRRNSICRRRASGSARWGSTGPGSKPMVRPTSTRRSGRWPSPWRRSSAR